MADLFSRSYHCLWVPCHNVPSKHSERLRISAPFPFPRRRISLTHHTHLVSNASSSSSSVPDDVDILSSTECSDGSFVFQFATASEIRDKLAELEREKLACEVVEGGGKAGIQALLSDSIENLNNEVDNSLGEESISSSIFVVGVADQNPKLLINEKESVVLVNESETPGINESQEIDRHLKLDSIEDGDAQHGVLSEDGAVECNGVPIVSEEESQDDGHKEVVVSTTVTAVLDVFSDIYDGASGEVEEKVDDHEEVDVSVVNPDLDMFGDLNSSASGEVQEKFDGDKEVAVSAVTPELNMFGDLNNSASGEVQEKFDGDKEVAVSAVTPELDMFGDLNSGASREVEEKVDGLAVSAATQELEMFGDLNSGGALGEVEEKLDGDEEDAILIVTPELDMFGDLNSGASGEVEEKVDGLAVSAATQELEMFNDLNSGGVPEEAEEKLDGDEEDVISTVTLESDMFSDLNNGASGGVEEKLDVHGADALLTVTPESNVSSDMNNGASGEVEEKIDDHDEASVSSVTPELDMFTDSSGASGEVDEKLDVSEEVAVSAVTPESDMFSDMNNGSAGEVEEKLDHEEVVVSTVTPEADMFTDMNNGAFGEVEEKLDDNEEVSVSTVTLEADIPTDMNSSAPGVVDEKLDSHEEAAISAVTSDMFANLNNGASEEVEEKLDDHEDIAISSVTQEENMLTDMISDASEEVDEKLDVHEKDAVSTVTPESDMFSDLNNGASGEVEEKLDGLEEVVISAVTESDMFSDLNRGASDEVEEKEGRRTAGVNTDLSELVPVSTSLDSEQATNNLTSSLESELIANDEETTHHIVDDSIDASEMGESAMLQDLVAPSDMENKIDLGNIERSDYETPSHLTVPELHSVETASYGENTSRTELFLVSGAACLPHPSKALTGREDAYFISHQNWLAVADGLGQWSLEGSNSELYIRELMEKCENIVSSYGNISTIKPAEVLTRSAAETQSQGSSSILVAYFDGEVLHAANVGNTGFIIIRDGFIFKKSTAKFHEFNFPLQIVKGDDPSEIIEGYKVDLCDGDVIIFATNGLFDNLYDQEIASTISKSLQASLGPQEFAEVLAKRAQEVGKSTSTRSPFADAAQAVGYVGYSGGKLDDVTVIVSVVQTR